MRLSLEETKKRITETRIIPLFFHADPDVAIKVLDALIDGGGDIIEFTNRGPEAAEVFEQLIEFKTKNHPTVLLGIGSVIDTGTAERYISAGADFVVTPLLEHGVIRSCIEKNILCIPGTSTLTEIHQAEILGATMVKVFPARQLGGPAYIKAIKGPCPWLSIIVTGGVKASAEDLIEWHNAGACGFGLGSDLISKDLIESGEFGQISEKVRELKGFINGLETGQC